ncbi:MAG: DUF1853 family protein, partial [Flavobacteriales bacterium]|nr:DUF1853 family protein [Flavobacteriales bacterium]
MLEVFYKNKIIRDLEQSIKSEFILKDDLCLPNSFLEIDNSVLDAWLLRLDKDPKELITFTEKRYSYRLGRYFENLLLFYFNFHPNIEVIEFGKQIFSGKRTIGEMDFILKNISTGQIVHLETALKYFAKEKDRTNFHSYICPNGSRTFGEKIDKIFSKQLKITETPEAMEFLKSIDVYPVKSFHFIKGTLFYHPDEADAVINERLNPLHLKGWWIYYKEIESLSNNSKYKLVHKLKWLSPEIEINDDKLLSKTQLLVELNQHFEIISQGQMIVEYYDVNGVWVEKSRGFVLDNG